MIEQSFKYAIAIAASLLFLALCLREVKTVYGEWLKVNKGVITLYLTLFMVFWGWWLMTYYEYFLYYWVIEYWN